MPHDARGDKGLRALANMVEGDRAFSFAAAPEWARNCELNQLYLPAVLTLLRENGDGQERCLAIRGPNSPKSAIDRRPNESTENSTPS